MAAVATTTILRRVTAAAKGRANSVRAPTRTNHTIFGARRRVEASRFVDDARDWQRAAASILIACDRSLARRLPSASKRLAIGVGANSWLAPTCIGWLAGAAVRRAKAMRQVVAPFFFAGHRRSCDRIVRLVVATTRSPTTTPPHSHNRWLERVADGNAEFCAAAF